MIGPISNHPAVKGVVAGMAAVEAGFQKAGAAADILGNSLTTNAQKNEALKESLIPLYASFKKFAEAVDGTTDRIRVAGVQLQRALVDLAAGAAANRQFRQNDATFGEPYRALLRAARAQGGLPAAGEYDRSTALGQRASEEALPVRAAEDARRRARLAAEGVREEQFARSAAMKDAVKAQAGGLLDAAGTLRRLKGLVDNENGGGGRNQAEKLVADVSGLNAAAGRRNKAGIAEAAAAAVQNTDRAKVLNETALEQIQRRQESVVKLANAERDARQANIGVLQAELAVLEQKEQRMAGFARQLGKLSEGEFQAAQVYLDEVLAAEKAGTLRDLPAHFFDAAAQIAPEYAQKQQEKVGAERGREQGKRYAGIDDSLVQDYTKGTLAQARLAVDAKRIDVRVEVDLDAVKTAEAIVERIKPVMAEYAAALKISVRLTNEAAEIKRIQAVNQQP